MVWTLISNEDPKIVSKGSAWQPKDYRTQRPEGFHAIDIDRDEALEEARRKVVEQFQRPLTNSLNK